MIKIYTKENKDDKILKKGCKKLKIDTQDVKFVAYEKFLFSYLFVLAIKGKKLYLLAEENGKSPKATKEIDINEVRGVSVDKHHDLNLEFETYKSINLTSIVNVTKLSGKIIETLNRNIIGSHY